MSGAITGIESYDRSLMMALTPIMTGMTVAASTVVLWMMLAVPLCITSTSAAKILIYPFGHCLNSHLLNAEKVGLRDR